MDIATEFNLAIACCRWSFAGADPEPVRRLARDCNWEILCRLSRFHRVQGLVFTALQEARELVPPAIMDLLCGDTRTIAAANLRAAAESRSLLSSFEAARVPLLFLKGLTLGALAYAKPALKAAIDIDLLVDPGDLGTAAELLRDSGYHSIAPQESGDNQALCRWHRGWKESVWIADPSQLRIDLHTRTADNPRLIPDIDVHSPSQSVRIADSIALPTLADEELFAYLTVHGASSGWFRLKWIADFAGLLHGRTPNQIEHLYRRSQQLGAGRAPGQALLLADRLFGTLEGAPALRAEVVSDPATRRLERASLRLLLSGPSEPTDRLLGTLPIHLTQFDLLPGLGYKLSELTGQVRRLFVRQA